MTITTITLLIHLFTLFFMHRIILTPRIIQTPYLIHEIHLSTSHRLGLYGPIKHARHLKADSHFVMKFTAGSLAGAIGSVVGNPFDVLKTRMMTAEGMQR